MLDLIAGAIVGGLSNRFAGWEKGNRYLPAALIWLLLFVFYGLEATVYGLAFLLWRTIGWYDSIDMGRNDGSFTRDFGVLTLISVLPAATIAILYPTWWIVVLGLIPPVTYAATMWGLPWNTKIRHIAVAESVTGALLGAGAVAIIQS